MFAIFTPSITILPSAPSIRRNSDRAREDLPAPVLPTMPICQSNKNGWDNEHNIVIDIYGTDNGSLNLTQTKSTCMDLIVQYIMKFFRNIISKHYMFKIVVTKIQVQYFHRSDNSVTLVTVHCSNVGACN